MASIRIGDMQIVSRPDGSNPPLKLIKALGVVALEMHQEWGRNPVYEMAHPDKSKESCILASLTVRDFLRAVGFERASICTAQVFIDAQQHGERLHSLVIGHIEAKGSGWSGHMVTVCNGWIIDTTIYQAIRPAWKDLPGMLVVPITKDGSKLEEKTLLTGFMVKDEGDYSLAVAWADDPTNKGWRGTPDAHRSRRAPMVRYLVDVVDRSRRQAQAKLMDEALANGVDDGPE